MQLAYVSEREGGGPQAQEAASAAHTLLMALGTDASHGMLPGPESRGDKEAYKEGGQGQNKQSTSAG